MLQYDHQTKQSRDDALFTDLKKYLFSYQKS